MTGVPHRLANARFRSRVTALRLGVVLCVVAATGTAAVRLDDTLGTFDLRADVNATYTYAQRAHTHPEWSAAGGSVLEIARLWMPEDASYRIIYGPRFDEARTSDFTHLFLIGFLLPRRPTASHSAEWAFCYGCTEETLRKRFDVLARVSGGPAFGRVVS